MKTYGGVEEQLHAFLTSGLDTGEWSASSPGRFTLRGKNPRHPLNRRIGGPQSRSGRRGEKKNSQYLPEVEPQSYSP
jgi:hypothetical protein